jgi:photosystem II biogenesis protein Psp29
MGRYVAGLSLAVDNVRTVSDTKRSFYTIHTRPINSIYRRVVDELMVEMHLLAVNVDYRYDPIYALGVFTSFHRFMQGYRPESDISSIFDGICQALQDDPQRYRRDADRLTSLAHRLSAQDVIDWLRLSASWPDVMDLQDQLRAIASNPKFKYSRLFAIGLFTVLELADANLVKDEAQRNEALKQICAALNLSEDKVQKDLELYRSNLEKVAQARLAMEELLKAEQKKRQERSQAKNSTSAPDATEFSTKDEAASGS